MRFVPFAIALTLACGAPASQALPAWARDGRTVAIPVREASGDVATMVTTTFLPPGPGPFPVVVFSHGRSGVAQQRASLDVGVSRMQLQYWLAKGAAVVAPVRPGYGISSGEDVEAHGGRRGGDGHCVLPPDFRKTADAATLAIAATVQWLHAQPWADAKRVLLVGQSVGGLATVAAGAKSLPGVVGIINFAGGAGGDPERWPGMSCDPDQLTRLYAGYGRTTHVPSLWLYAANDRFWGPDEPRAWHAAFAQGRSATTFVQAPAVADGDGHGLANHEPALWAPAVEQFLAKVAFVPAR